MTDEDEDPGGHQLGLREDEGGYHHFNLANRRVSDGDTVFVLWECAYVRGYSARFRWSGGFAERPMVLVGRVPIAFGLRTTAQLMWKPGLRFRSPGGEEPGAHD